MRITPNKAIEILGINLKEAGLKMPLDCRTALELSLDLFAVLIHERDENGYTRLTLQPHEEPANLS